MLNSSKNYNVISTDYGLRYSLTNVQGDTLIIHSLPFDIDNKKNAAVFAKDIENLLAYLEQDSIEPAYIVFYPETILQAEIFAIAVRQQGYTVHYGIEEGDLNYARYIEPFEWLGLLTIANCVDDVTKSTMVRYNFILCIEREI